MTLPFVHQIISRPMRAALVVGAAVLVVGIAAGTAPRAEDPSASPAQSGTEVATSAPPAGQTSTLSNQESNLVNREVYVYKTIGRRDPFASLLEGEFETTVGHPLLDVSSMRLVGIVWGEVRQVCPHRGRSWPRSHPSRG